MLHFHKTNEFPVFLAHPTASPDTILKLDTLVMIQTKFGFHWSCTFRGEDFLESLRRTTTTDNDDGRQVMAIE
jgi:hypothetical protein